jgi:hypothetical protein
MKRVLALFLISLSSVAHAGVETVGDGGVAVVCGTRVRLLDFYETEILHGIHADFLEKGRTLQQGMDVALSRLSEIMSPWDFAAVRSVFYWVLQDRLAISPFDGDFPSRTNDNIPRVTLPESCALAQLAMFDRSHRIHYNEAAWLLLSSNDQVGLLLHEAFHFVFPRGDTREIREVVGYLGAPQEFREGHRAEVVDILRRNLPWRMPNR